VGSTGARYLAGARRYDLVLVLLPSPDTHGHHQTVAQLTLEAVANLEPPDRPAVLGTRTMTAVPGFLNVFGVARISADAHD